jgi:hypothetical protein
MDFPSPTSPTPFKAASLYLTVDGQAVGLKSYPCEDPRYSCGITRLPDSGSVYIGLSKTKVSVGFNRISDGLDYSIPVDISQASRERSGQFEQFSQCIGTMLDRAQEANRK